MSLDVDIVVCVVGTGRMRVVVRSTVSVSTTVVDGASAVVVSAGAVVASVAAVVVCAALPPPTTIPPKSTPATKRPAMLESFTAFGTGP